MRTTYALRTYSEYLERKQKEHGAKFDHSDLDPRFIPAFETMTRIRVKFPWGEVRTGTVGVTTGWKPVFLLMARSDSHGSSDLLNKEVQFTTEHVTRGEVA